MSLASQHGYRSKHSPPYFNTSPTSHFQHSYGRRSRCSDLSWGWQSQILRSHQTSTRRRWGFQRREGPSTGLWWLTCSDSRAWGDGVFMPKRTENQLPVLQAGHHSHRSHLCPCSLLCDLTSASSSLPPILWFFSWNCIPNPLPQVLVLRLCFQGNPCEDRCSYNFEKLKLKKLQSIFFKKKKKSQVKRAGTSF